jgi:superfamily I DNA/RNA helicase
MAGLPSYVYKGLGFFDADEIKDLLALLWYLAEPASDLRAAAFFRSRFVRLSDEALRRLAPALAGALSVRSRGSSAFAAATADKSDCGSGRPIGPVIWFPFCRSCSRNMTCRHVDAPRWPVLS